MPKCSYSVFERFVEIIKTVVENIKTVVEKMSTDKKLGLLGKLISRRNSSNRARKTSNAGYVLLPFLL